MCTPFVCRFWFFFVIHFNQVYACQLLSFLCAFMFDWSTFFFVLLVIMVQFLMDVQTFPYNSYKLLHSDFSHTIFSFFPNRIFFSKTKVVFVYLSCIVHVLYIIFPGVIFVFKFGLYILFLIICSSTYGLFLFFILYFMFFTCSLFLFFGVL